MQSWLRLYLCQAVFHQADQFRHPVLRSFRERHKHHGAWARQRTLRGHFPGPPHLVHRGDLDADGGTGQTPAQSNKSEAELEAEAISSTLNDALRKPQQGETRLLGTLSRIECGSGGLVFSVESGDRTLRLTSRDFESLHIVAYTPQAGNQLTCGPRKIQSRVVVTYRAATGGRNKTDGAAVALEFVPETFKLSQ